LSGEETQFPVVMRGYERAAVDDAILDLRKELMHLSAQNAQLAQELKTALAELEQAKLGLAEAGDPSYSGVGARAALILSTAEDQALKLTQDAERDIERQKRALNEEIDNLRGEAKGYYDSLVAEAQRRADRIVVAARSDYDEMLSQARSEATRISEESIREAGSIRGAISTEVAKMKATAKREIEAQKAAVERDLAERKLIAFRELSGAVDFDAANALITQQARIDLELELTARRQEAESEYLRKHQEAVAATQKYLDDANAQLSLALTRANAARLEAETLEAAAISINQQTTEAARKKADAIIAAAEAEARSVSSQSQQDLEQQYAAAKTELERLQSERESVEVYLKNLRNVLQGATGGNENSTY
jgi:cell division septum initiation protein DivIVA